MNRKLVLILTLTFLFGTSNVAFDVQKAKASGTIYIRADGSVDPPTPLIMTVDNSTYTFTGNISDSIVVKRDNIVVNGAGYTLQGTGSENGIDLSSISNVTIKNIEIREFDFGIYLNHSVSNTIAGNFLTAINFEGIRLYESSNNNITGNNMIMNDWDAVTLYGSSDNKIVENNLTRNYDGIRLYESSNNSIVENIVANNQYGIFLAFSSNNSLLKNNVTANDGNGISLLWSSNENRIAENLVIANKWHGLHLNESSNNIIYHNSFMDNSQQVDLNNSVNVWDVDYPSGGNYWSDYNGTDANHDSIGDAPYIIDGNNTDHYPLMTQYIPEFPSFLILPLCSIATLLAVIVYRKKHSKITKRP
jgi:parallel beta-helix repeat protein